MQSAGSHPPGKNQDPLHIWFATRAREAEGATAPLSCAGGVRKAVGSHTLWFGDIAFLTCVWHVPILHGTCTSQAPWLNYKLIHFHSKRSISFAVIHAAIPKLHYSMVKWAMRTKTSFKPSVHHSCPYVLLNCALIPSAAGWKWVGVGDNLQPTFVFILLRRREMSWPFSWIKNWFCVACWAGIIWSKDEAVE